MTSTLRQMGPSRAKAKHTSLCCYRHPQARPRLRARIQNEPSHLALPLQPSLPLPCFRLMLREQRASAFNGASQFFILLAPQPPNPPPSLPTFSLHFRKGCGNTSADIQTASRLPTGAEGELQTGGLILLTHTLNKSLHL